MNKKAARDAAINSGSPYGTIFTTTAGRRSSKSGKFAYEMFSTGMKWTEKLFDCSSKKELKDIVRKNSTGRAPMLILEFNHRQLGYTDEWLNRKIEEAMADEISVRSEFLNHWVDANASSPISKENIEKLNKSMTDPLYTEISKHGYVLNWYVTEEVLNNSIRNNKIVIGLDTSDAVGKDGIALVIRDVKTGEVLGTGSFNETNLILFSEFLFYLLVKLMRAVLVIERRSSAAVIIDNLILLMQANGMDPFKRIFNWIVDDAELNTRKYDEIDMNPERRNHDVYIKFRKEFGYATSGSGRSSRDNLYGDTLMKAIKYTGTSTRDKTLIGQIFGLVIKNGRIDHKSGENDDLVIAYLLSYWFLLFAKNIEFYGIDSTDTLSMVSMNDSSLTVDLEKQQKIQEQNALRTVMDDLLEEIRNEHDFIKAGVLTNKVRYLNTFIDETLTSPLNLHARLRDIELSKNNNKNKSYFR